jgi:tetratricopeptide (TPR) repeat protein
VAGLDFPREAVEELMPAGREAVAGNLHTLTTRRLIGRSEPMFGGDAYRFANGMVRETAYAALLKKSRAEMHEGYAGWLETRAGDRVLEHQEILGYHLEQSFRYRGELGPLDDHGRAVGRRAAELLGEAGKRALARGDIPAAANLLGRAVAPLDRLDPLRLELLPDLAEAVADAGDLDRAGALLEDAIAGAREIGDEVLEAHALLARLYVRFWADPEGWRERAFTETEGALATFERLDDALGSYRVWRLRTNMHGMAGQYTDAEHAAGEALRYAEALGASDKAAATASSFAMAALFGTTPVDVAIPRCEQALDDAQGDRRSEGIVLTSLAHLCGLAGSFDRARDLYARGRALYEDLGDRILAASTSLDSGKVELFAGDLAAAERELRPDYETLTAMGESSMRPMTAAILGQVLFREGRIDEADALATACEEASASDDTDNQVMWRRLRARVEALRGAHEDAARLAREATELAGATEAVIMQAEAWMDLAAVRKRAGDQAEAKAALARALELCASKGASAAAAYVRQTFDAA